jgi:hypothetical protein
MAAVRLERAANVVRVAIGPAAERTAVPCIRVTSGDRFDPEILHALFLGHDACFTLLPDDFEPTPPTVQQNR